MTVLHLSGSQGTEFPQTSAASDRTSCNARRTIPEARTVATFFFTGTYHSLPVPKPGASGTPESPRTPAKHCSLNLRRGELCKSSRVAFRREREYLLTPTHYSS